MNSKRLKILLSLFTINSLSLYLYFSFQPDRHRPPSGSHSPPGIHPPLSAKPWPILPSYLPWSNDQRTPPLRSCEAYFGNGFSDRVDPMIQTSGGGRGGWFRCFYSETLRSSICEGGRIRMTPDRIRMSIGGEKLESVIGRGEDDELPKFDDGAFEIETDNRSRAGEKMADEYFLDRYINEGAVDRHTMRELIDSIRLVDDSQFNCSKWIEEPVILVTRFEYANLFHTITDWYSTYVASRVTGIPNRPHLVFVDGHCETPLEETWTALYSSITYAKNFTGPVCFRHAILAPLGYETPLFRGLTENIDCRGAPAHDLWKKPDNRKTARLSEFGEMIRSAFGFPVDRHRPISPPRVSGLNILFVRRENYLAHPRHGGKIQTRLTNEQEVFDAVLNWASNYSGCELNIVNGMFAHMPMKEQVRAIQDAAVIVGAHGAGLTHIVSADGKAVILEIISSQYRRPHFELIARWKGLEYHAMNLAGSYADPLAVVDRLSGIVRRLGC